MERFQGLAAFAAAAPWTLDFTRVRAPVAAVRREASFALRLWRSCALGGGCGPSLKRSSAPLGPHAPLTRLAARPEGGAFRWRHHVSKGRCAHRWS